jgi:hypothetical protein
MKKGLLCFREKKSGRDADVECNRNNKPTTTYNNDNSINNKNNINNNNEVKKPLQYRPKLSANSKGINLLPDDLDLQLR